MLPLGRRVQDKLEALIDTHMSSLGMIPLSIISSTHLTTAAGASKVALSSVSSQELWTKSGRLNKVGSEVCQFI
jgi:prolyl-tRNA synthetase